MWQRRERQKNSPCPPRGRGAGGEGGLKSSMIAAVVFPVLLGACFAEGTRADNVVANPSAEQVAADGTPAGWGLYIGSGRFKLTASNEQKHSGERSACIEPTEWYTPPGGSRCGADNGLSAARSCWHPTTAIERRRDPVQPRRHLRLFVLVQGRRPQSVGERDGLAVGRRRRYQANRHFRVGRGNVARPGVAEVHRPFSYSRRRASVRPADSCRRHEREGFALGKKLYVDDADIRPRMYPDGELRAIWGPLPKSSKRDEGLREIAASLDKIKSGGLQHAFRLDRVAVSRRLGSARTPEARAAGRLGRLGEK